MNKTIYLRLSILEDSKLVKNEFWYDQVKPKYREKAKLCYMDAGIFIFIVYIKTKDISVDIAKGDETIFDT